MLPEFPWFKSIDLSDRAVVESMIAGYPPYADFNFVEIWCWNRDHGGVATLDDNLVIRWQDISSGELYLTFLGTNRVERTAARLIAYAKEQGMEPRLQAVPDVVVKSGAGFGETFVVEEDLRNSDYLLSVDDWASMAGGRFKNKRNAIHRLERNHRPRLVRLDLRDEQTQSEIMELCHTWSTQRDRTPEEFAPEFRAIANLIELAREADISRLVVPGVYVGDRLVGFSINEILPDGYGLGHFAKADYRYEGVYPYMLNYVARQLQQARVRYLNIEADLGDDGLAISKRLCHPVGRLRKYLITESTDRSNGRRPAGVKDVPAARTA